MKKFLTLFLILMFTLQNVYAATALDLSVDDEIRRNYLNDEISLPPLPKTYQSESEIEYTEIEIEPTIKNVPIKDNFAVLKRGTKLQLKSLSQISDKTKAGTKVSFTLLYPVCTTYFTMPKGTTIYGKVIKTHTPQIAGNGGLIVIRLYSFKLNGTTYNFDGRVLKTGSKHIFLNNIKGKRKYLSSIPKTIKWGRNYKNKMYKLTGNFAKEKATWILCPFSALFGTLGYAGNLILSPILAIKYKGDRIILNKETIFTFKLTEDVNIFYTKNN